MELFKHDPVFEQAPTFFSVQDIINSLTKEDVINFLQSLGVTKIEEHEDFLICPTICHHQHEDEGSMKLYWYNNSKLFQCYTQCGDYMSIFELYQRHMELLNQTISFEAAKQYVVNILHHEIIPVEKESVKFDKIEERLYHYNFNVPQLPEYSTTVLDCFEDYYHPTWIKDGISIDVMRANNIKFWRSQNKIIIPHYDKDNRLIGIRARELEPELVDIYGKYHPISIGDKMYKHILHFNLYGINNQQYGINKRHSAIIVEGEKSVLLDQTYYGKYGNAVACCGSSFSSYQLALLIDNFDINEIILAFDKEYDNWTDEPAKIKRRELEKKYKPFTNRVKVSYIWDTLNLLNKKDSPYDKGQEVFEQLFSTRIQIR